MSETEEDRRYYQAAEAAFIRRRGTPFLLSPRDFAQIKEWRALGVPLEAVEQGIDEAFSRREERSATGRVNSLRYCRDAVLEAWERRAETAVGREKGRPGSEPDVPAAIGRLRASLESLAGRRPDLAAAVLSILRSLERIEKAGRTAEETEAALARLDRRLARELLQSLPEKESRQLHEEVETSLARAGMRMDAETARRTASALARRKLREMLELPRLSLL